MNSSSHHQFVSLVQVVKKLMQRPAANWMERVPTYIQINLLEVENYERALSMSTAANRLLNKMAIDDEIRRESAPDKTQITDEPWIDADSHPGDHPDGLRAEIRLLLQSIKDWPIRVRDCWSPNRVTAHNGMFLREKDRKRSNEIELDEHSARRLVIGISDRWERSIRLDASWPKPESDISDEPLETVDEPTMPEPAIADSPQQTAVSASRQASYERPSAALSLVQQAPATQQTSSIHRQTPHPSTDYIIDLVAEIVEKDPKIGLAEQHRRAIRILETNEPDSVFLGKNGATFEFNDDSPRNKLTSTQIRLRIKSNQTRIQDRAEELKNGQRKISASK